MDQHDTFLGSQSNPQSSTNSHPDLKACFGRPRRNPNSGRPPPFWTAPPRSPRRVGPPNPLAFARAWRRWSTDRPSRCVRWCHRWCLKHLKPTYLLLSIDLYRIRTYFWDQNKKHHPSFGWFFAQSIYGLCSFWAQLTFAIIIFVNTILMAVQVQYRGLNVGHVLNYWSVTVAATAPWFSWCLFWRSEAPNNLAKKNNFLKNCDIPFGLFPCFLIPEESWPHAEVVFFGLELCFGVIFTLETWILAAGWTHGFQGIFLWDICKKILTEWERDDPSPR